MAFALHFSIVNYSLKGDLRDWRSVFLNRKILIFSTIAGDIEVQNQVTKLIYAKWRDTSSFQLENFYRNSSFELLTQLCKKLNQTSRYWLKYLPFIFLLSSY